MEKIFFTLEEGKLGGLDLFTVKSKALGQRADVSCYTIGEITKYTDVVFLLHGVYGSHWAWPLKSTIIETTETLYKEGLIKDTLLVFPSDGLFADGSGYLAHNHADYEKWISEDLFKLIEKYYKLIPSLQSFFIAGLSMGGYGALRIGAKNPELFKAFSGLSPITQFQEFKMFVEDYEQLKNSVKEKEEVLDILIRNKAQLRSFRFDCGKADSLFPGNELLHQQLCQAKIPHVFEALEGEHTWDYWSTYISKTLTFFASISS